MNYCDFIAAIEADPNKKITGLKVKDFLALRQHVILCIKCNQAVSRTLRRAPKKTMDQLHGEN